MKHARKRGMFGRFIRQTKIRGRRIVTLLSAAFLVGGALPCSIAQNPRVLLAEDFDYPQGDLLTQHGWVVHSSGDMPIAVTAGLVFEDYQASGIGGAAAVFRNGEDVHRNFTQVVSNDTLYMAFLFNVGRDNAAGYFMHFLEDCSNDAFASRIYAADDGTWVGISETSTMPDSNARIAIRPNTTYLGVVEFNFTDKRSKLYVFDEIPEAKPDKGFVMSASAAMVSNIGAASLRQFNDRQHVIVDGIYVARRWSDALPASMPAPPAFVEKATVVAASVTSVSANITATLDRKATLYRTVRTSAAPAITAAEVAATASDSVDAAANVQANIFVNELHQATTYYIYLAARNKQGFSEVDSVVLTTNSMTAPSLVVDKEALQFDTIVGQQQSRMLTIRCLNLGAAASISLGSSRAFTLSTTSAPSGYGLPKQTDVTVTYTAEYEPVTDTLFIRARGIERRVVLHGTSTYSAISVSPKSLHFHSIKGKARTHWLTVRGRNLVGDIKAELTSGAHFKLSKKTVDAQKAASVNGDTLAITFDADNLTYDTLLLTEQAADTIRIPICGELRKRYENMVLNPGFESWTREGPKSWQVDKGYGREGEQVFRDDYSLKFSATKTVKATQHIEGVEGDTRYTISFWYYIDERSTGLGLRLYSQFANDNTYFTAAEDPNIEEIRPSGNTGYQNVKGEWMQFEINTYVAPKGATRFVFEIRTYNGTTAYIDDVFFSEYNPRQPYISIAPGIRSFASVAPGESVEDSILIRGTYAGEALTLKLEGKHPECFTAPANAKWQQGIVTTLKRSVKVGIGYRPSGLGRHSATLTVSGKGASRKIALTGTCSDISGIKLTPISSICTGANPSPYKDSTVSVAGIVAATAAGNSFFLQDSSGATHGIYIYRRGELVRAGDSVVVSGTVVEYNGVTEISVADDSAVHLAGRGRATFEATKILPAQLEKSHHAVLVAMDSMEVTAIEDAKRFTVARGSTQLTVADDIYNATRAVEVGALVNITGLGFTSGGQPVLLPRSASDVEVVRAAVKYYAMRIEPATGGCISVASNDRALETDTLLPAGTLLHISATPDEGYALATLTVNDTAHHNGDAHLLTRNIQIAATFSRLPTSAKVAAATDAQVYPNPVHSVLHVQSPKKIRKVAIYTLSGLLVLKRRAGKAIDVRSLRSGTYVVNITFADGSTLAGIIAKK